MRTASRFSLSAPFVGAALFLTGCLPTTLSPLWTERDLVDEPALAGTWVEEDDRDKGQKWTFERKAGEPAWRLAMTDEEGKVGHFEAHLLRLGEHRYLDFEPASDALDRLDENDLYRYLLTPVHTFLRVRLGAGTLELDWLKLDWLNEQLKAKPGLVAHHFRDPKGEAILLTAPTEALQRFVRTHADVADAWDTFKLVRQGPNPDAPAPKP